MGLTRRPILSVAWLPLFAVVLMLVATPPIAAQSTANLLHNGGFERGVNAHDEPVGWHTRLTSVIPIPEYRDPENKQGRTGRVFFRDGGNHEWGTFRPWAMLRSPANGHVITGLEDAGAYYDKNHESVTLGPGRQGRGVHISMTGEVGSNQGVRVLSHLVKADGEAVYEISFDALSRAPHLRVFVEGFRLEPLTDEEKAVLAELPPGSNVYNIEGRLRRVYRRQVNAEIPRQWTRFSEMFAAPNERYTFDYLMVNLYAFLPGEAAYDNVVLRRVTPREAAAYRRELPRREIDSRYRY